MTSEPEIYRLSDWRNLPDRARGSKARPASKVKAAFRTYLDQCQSLTNAEKRVGGLLVDWYNPARGYSWPSTVQLAEELALGRATVERATAKLDRLGLVRKKVGGGWDGKKARLRANQYYPTFSLVLNPTTHQIIKNAPYPSLESPETRRNPGKHPLNLRGPQNEGVLFGGNPQESAEVPPQNEGPYTDNVYAAGANASPATPNGSGARAATPPEEESLNFVEQAPAVTVTALARALDVDPDGLLNTLSDEWAKTPEPVAEKLFHYLEKHGEKYVESEAPDRSEVIEIEMVHRSHLARDPEPEVSEVFSPGESNDPDAARVVVYRQGLPVNPVCDFRPYMFVKEYSHTWKLEDGTPLPYETLAAYFQGDLDLLDAELAAKVEAFWLGQFNRVACPCGPDYEGQIYGGSLRVDVITNPETGRETLRWPPVDSLADADRFRICMVRMIDG
jgi:hypothetical protein